MKYVLSVLFSTLPVFAASPWLPKPTGWLDVADCSAISGWASSPAVDLYDGAIEGIPFAPFPPPIIAPISSKPELATAATVFTCQHPRV